MDHKITTIRNDVWIGTRSIVMGGVIIENGAIIAANSVVTKSIPPYTVSAGIPARVIRQRFSDPIIEKLLKIKPWLYDLRAAASIDERFSQSMDERFLEIFQEVIESGNILPLHTNATRVQPQPQGGWAISSCELEVV